QKPRDAKQDIPEDRAQYAIDEIFAEAFNCGAPARRNIHFFNITPNEHSNGLPRRGNIVAVCRSLNFTNMNDKIMQSKADVDQDHVSRDSGLLIPVINSVQEQTGYRDPCDGKHEKEHDSAGVTIASHAPQKRFISG